MSRPRLAAALAAGTVVLASVVTSPLGAQQGDPGPQLIDPERAPRPAARITRAEGRITVDGRVDETAWDRATPITEFIQAQPNTGHPATERTVARLLYDERNLYISAVCYDSEPDAMVVKTLERDYPGVLSEDMDSFGFSLDTFLDRRNSFLFFINPRGGIKDGQTFNDGTTRDYNWDGIVDVRTTVHDSGWTVEVAVPWSTLRFDPARDPQTWGINLLRRVRRKNEVAYWAPLGRRDRIFLMSQAGTLSGLPRVRASRNLLVKPFGLARRAAGANLAPDDAGNDADGGVDVKYGITPQVTLDLSYRTDFSHADVDQEQLNLTRFPLFFPEQRDFFLENSGIFTFGDVTAPGAPRSGTSLRDFTLFHSRSIGLRRGVPVPLVGGARLTGRAASFEFGALNVQSDSFGADPAENFSAVRVRRNVLGNSDIGLLFTNRAATGSGTGYSRSFGTDLNMRLAQYLFVSSYVALTRSPAGGDEAARLAVGWRDRLWDGAAQLRHVGDSFSPGMGFIRRRGIRQWYGTFGAHPQVRGLGVLEINPYVEADYITDLAGDRLQWDGTLGFGITFRDGGVLSTQINDRRERLDQPFQVRAGIAVPAGDYHTRDASLSYSSSDGRNVSGTVGLSGGEYYDGDRFTVSGTLSWQPDYHLTLQASASHNAVTVRSGHFNADLYTGRVRYAFTTTLNVMAFVQYNADADQLVSNVRLNYIHAPLSDLFLVFTERRDVAPGGAGVLERFVTLKVTKLFAF